MVCGDEVCVLWTVAGSDHHLLQFRTKGIREQKRRAEEELAGRIHDGRGEPVWNLRHFG